jgi:hypothetical protein
MPEPDVLAALEADGLVAREGATVVPTRRWRAAIARAARRLALARAPWKDLRLPIAFALVELRGDLPDEEIARRVEVLLPLESRWLGTSAPDAVAQEREG